MTLLPHAHVPGVAAVDREHVAVCIPAHGSPASLRAVLKSLNRLDYPTHLLQVIVAVDGPDSALEETARASGATTVVLPQNQGSYAARNAAVEAIDGPVTAVLFTDAGCEVTPQWVREHLRVLGQADLSGGAVEVTTSARPTPAEWVDAGRHLRQQHFVERVGFAATCNLAVRAGVLHRLRFDASLRSGGDFDFGRRAGEAGFSIAYAPGAVVRHPARSTTREVLKKVRRVARGASENQRRGADAAARRDPSRGPAAGRPGTASVDQGLTWRMRVRLLDATCSLVYARYVPAVVAPAVRRRLRVTR